MPEHMIGRRCSDQAGDFIESLYAFPSSKSKEVASSKAIDLIECMLRTENY